MDHTTDITAAAAALGRRGGQSTSQAKAAAARANGRLGGATLRNTYYILSGEGEYGTWAGPYTTTGRGIRARLTRERAGGDRWASAWELCPATATSVSYVRDIDGSDRRDVPAAD